MIHQTLLFLIRSRLLLPLLCLVLSTHNTRNLHSLNCLYSHHPWPLLLRLSLNRRLSVAAAMEDLNTLASDCVVICCCCQCLILQILVFALLRLPAKLAKRARDFAKRKVNRRRIRRRSGEIGSYIGEIVTIKEEEFCVRVRAEKESDFGDDDENEGRGRGETKCIEEVEKVMMGLYEKGEFGFGSFWGREREREESGCSVSAINVRTVSQIEDEEEEEEEEDEDDHFVKYQIIQMAAGSFRKS